MSAVDISDITAEAGVVASVLLRPELVFYSEQLNPHHFTNEQNSYLYFAVCELAKQGVERIDTLNIENILNGRHATREKAKTILTTQAINEFISIAPTIARTSVEEYKLLADAVLRAAFRRHTYNKLIECQQYCLRSEEADIEHKIYTELDNVMMEFSANATIPIYRDVIDEMWSEIKKRQQGETKAIEFPFPLLNEYVVMEPGEVICFTGAAKSGKSAMLLTCTVDLLRKGKSVLYIDSEISTKLFTLRIICHLTGIKFADLRSGNYSPAEEVEINKAVEWLKTRNFIHVYMPVFDENAMYLAVKKAKHLIDVECVVVDYLKSTSSKDEAFSVYSEMGRLSDMLKNRVCGDMGLCGLTAAQATNTGKIADSARIARSVSTVVSILDKSVEEVEADNGECGTKKLRVVFNRNGAQMQEDEWIDMEFHGSTITYKQAERQHAIIDPY